MSGSTVTTLDRLIAGRPAAPAIRNDTGVISRGALRDAAAAMAAALHQRGLRRGDAVGIWLPEGPAWLQTLFAAARLGLFLVPVSTRYTEREAAHALTVAGARAIVTTDRFLDIPFAEMVDALRPHLPALEHVIIIQDSQRLHPAREGCGGVAAAHPGGDGFDDAITASSAVAGGSSDAAALRADDRAFPLVCFSTSGTTGLPKLAAHGQASIARHAWAAAQAFDIGPDDAMLCALPFYGVFGFMTALAALAGGACCTIQPVFDGEHAAAAFGDGITHFIGSDAMYDAIFDRAGARFETLRRGGIADFVGRAAHWVSTLERRHGARISGLYGSSECYALMAMRDPQAPAAQRAIGGGRVVDPEIEIRVRDPRTGQPCAVGQAGELWVRGPNVLSAYVNNPQASERAIDPDGWFRTGDLCALDGEDSFTYYARLNDGLRMSGYLVDPAEIERWLCEHPGIAAAQVVGVRTAGQGDRAVAFVVPVAGSPTDLPAWEAHCRAGLAAFKRPARIVAIDAFPVVNGPNGAKIQKAVLRERAAGLLAAEGPSRS
ncbi:MAG: AMP-binding protein [Burkholderiaceae bacterium]